MDKKQNHFPKNMNNNENSAINELKKELEKTKSNFELCLNKYNNKKAECNDLNKKYLKLEEEKNKLKNELNEKSNILEFSNKKLTNLESEFNQKLEEKEEKIKILEEKLTETIKEKENLNSYYNGVVNQFEEMGNKIKDQNNQLEDLAKIKEKKNYIEEVFKKEETKEDYFIKSAEEYYDVVIDINSINALKNEGWQIKYNNERKEIYDKIVSGETIKIGVLGLNNVGKSYLLSKIARSEIPTGYSIETKGISIKYAVKNQKGDNNGEINGICILDSAGFETPLLQENNNLVEEEKKNDNRDELEKNIKFDEIDDILSRDKAQTERFIEQLILSLSDMVILVIGKLTRTEQRLITRIKNISRINEKNKIKSILIVHNLAQYHKKKEVDNHIEHYLTKSATFKLKKRKAIGIAKYEDRDYFVEQFDEQEDIEVFHYIMAKEGTEAGDYHNNFTLELIKNQFNSFNKRRAINIPQEIKNLFSELSTDILGEKMDVAITGKDNNTIKLIENNNKHNKGGNNKLYVQNRYMDQNGIYLKNKGKFEPKYSLYFYKEKKKVDDEEEEEENNIYQNYLLLRLEIPGNITRLTARSTDPKTEKANGIIIRGNKKRDAFDERKKEDFTIISDNRNYDDFSYFIELQPNIELSELTAKGYTEIYQFDFDKRNKEKYFPKENLGNSVNPMMENNVEKQENPKENIKEFKPMKIASGVYVMKFRLTERSYIPNK